MVINLLFKSRADSHVNVIDIVQKNSRFSMICFLLFFRSVFISDGFLICTKPGNINHIGAFKSVRCTFLRTDNSGEGGYKYIQT